MCIIVVILPLVLGRCSKPQAITCTGTVSFSRDIVPITNSHCAISGCHTGPNPTGFLNLDSAHAYQNLITKGYVIAGKPSYSIMYEQMTNSGGSRLMPPTGQLDHTFTDKVYCWIQEGALSN